MAVSRPIKLPPRPTGIARVVQRKNYPVLALSAIALALAVLVGHDVFFPSGSGTPVALRTASVTRGTVTNSVTATGTLVPAQQLTLGFKTAGTLTEVDVKVGDTVTAGEQVAKIDTAPLDLALQQAQASLASAQATLSSTLSGTALQQAQDSLNQAHQSYGDAVNQVNQANAADQAVLSADQATLAADQAAYAADQAALTGSAQVVIDQRQLAFDQLALASATSTFNADGCPTATFPYTDPKCPGDASSVSADGALVSADKLKLGADQAAAAPNYNADQTRIPADQSKVSADGSKLSADQQSGQRTLNQSAGAITSAQDAYNNQAVNRPSTIQQQQAMVASAAATVATAQANLTAATLTAPTDGVISGISAQAGDGVTAGGSSSGAQAPGTTALLPSATGSTGSNSAASSGGFMTLMSANAYVAVVSFAESDAAKVTTGLTGALTFDAISGLSIPVHVVGVAASSTVSSSVVNYYVSLTLDRVDSRLKAGLTANATVITARATNALLVPNSAITRRAGTTVTVLTNGKQVVTPVTVGITGATFTEVLTGLQQGETVVLPAARTTTTGTTTGGGGRGFGGGGGGGGVIAGGG